MAKYNSKYDITRPQGDYRKFLTTPVNPEFYQTVRVAAAKMAIPITEFIRMAIFDYIKKDNNG